MSNGIASNTKRLRKTQENPALVDGESMTSKIYSRLGDEVTAPLQEAILAGQKMSAGNLSAEQRRLIDSIVHNASTTMQRAGSYFDLLRLEAGELALQTDTLDVEQAIVRAIAVAQPSAKSKGVTLVAERSLRPVPPVTADPDRLSQVLGSLIDNAVKFTERGQVTVSTEIYDRSVAIHIVDTGVGISLESQPRLFEDFYYRENQKPRDSKRAGLGLTLSRRLILRMGGDFWFSSTVGAGSRFSFTVPRSVDTTGRPRMGTA
jgi:signal transduction histidine kinase